MALCDVHIIAFINLVEGVMIMSKVKNLLLEVEKATQKKKNESHLSVDSWADQLDVEEQTSLVNHQQQQEEDSR